MRIHQRSEDGPASPDGLLPLLPRLFLASHLRQLAWYGYSDLLTSVRRFIEDREAVPALPTVADLLESAFAIIQRDYPVEHIFKTFLMHRRLFGKHSPRTTACYVEQRVGSARADMLLVNGEAEVFEIKTWFDSPDRLTSQLREYYRCFTKVTVVTDPRCAKTYLDRLPLYVGVAVLERDGYFRIGRDAADHHDCLDHSSMFQILHQSERNAIVEELGGRVTDGYSEMRDRFEASFSTRRAYATMVAALRSRQPTERLAGLAKKLPFSLLVAPFSCDLRLGDWRVLLELLKTEPRTRERRECYYDHVFSLSQEQSNGRVGAPRS